MPSAAIRDNPALSRFELDAGGVTAVAYYKLADGVITFTHTEVPPHAQGAGIASSLIAGALEAARARTEGHGAVPFRARLPRQAPGVQ